MTTPDTESTCRYFGRHARTLDVTPSSIWRASEPQEIFARYGTRRTSLGQPPKVAVGEYGGLDLDGVRELEDVYDGYTYFAEGDLCIAKITPCFENGKGTLAEGLTNGVGFGTTELHVVRPGPKIDRRFLFYVSIADDFRKLGESEMYGAAGQKRIDESFIKDWVAPLPPLDTQRRIARFLDGKTARIDGLIEKKRALLDRLAEKRQALITGAVTKGLSPDAPMKPSGIDWLGDIPAHWEIVPLRWYLRTASGEGLRNVDIAAERTETDYASVIGGNGTMGFTDATNSEKAILVIGRVGAHCGNVHPIDEPSWITDNALRVYDVRSFDRDYLLFTLRTRDLNTLASRNAQPLMTGETVKAQCLPCPPASEQQAIGKELEQSLGDLEDNTARVNQSIRLLFEYRSAIISAAVTGQRTELR